jgi:hypothetical protein
MSVGSGDISGIDVGGGEEEEKVEKTKAHKSAKRWPRQKGPTEGRNNDRPDWSK